MSWHGEKPSGYGKISVLVHDLMPGVKYRFSVKTKTVCSHHPLVFKVSHPSNFAIAKTCHPYESHGCIGCGCKLGDYCEHC